MISERKSRGKLKFFPVSHPLRVLKKKVKWLWTVHITTRVVWSFFWEKISFAITMELKWNSAKPTTKLCRRFVWKKMIMCVIPVDSCLQSQALSFSLIPIPPSFPTAIPNCPAGHQEGPRLFDDASRGFRLEREWRHEILRHGISQHEECRAGATHFRRQLSEGDRRRRTWRKMDG